VEYEARVSPMFARWLKRSSPDVKVLMELRWP